MARKYSGTDGVRGKVGTFPITQTRKKVTDKFPW